MFREFFTKIRSFFISKSKSPKLTLEYLIILQESGLPAFSRCWGDFCSLLTVDDSLFSGFISAITTMPKMFSSQTSALQGVDLDFTKLLFTHTTPSNFIICTGFRKTDISDKSKKIVDKLNQSIQNVLENDLKDAKWNFMSVNELKEVEKIILEKAIFPWMHVAGAPPGHEKTCPVCADLLIGEDKIGHSMPFWERVKMIVDDFKQSLKAPEAKSVVEDLEKLRQSWIDSKG